MYRTQPSNAEEEAGEEDLVLVHRWAPLEEEEEEEALVHWRSAFCPSATTLPLDHSFLGLDEQ